MKVHIFYTIPKEITVTCGNCGFTHTYKENDGWKCLNCKADLSKRKSDNPGLVNK